METFMATRIEEAREISLEKGQAKYRAYFVRKSAAKLYGRYQDTVIVSWNLMDFLIVSYLSNLIFTIEY